MSEEQINNVRSLEAAWINAKKEEDKAKEARILLENMILEAIGWSEGDPNFKTWTDELKITFGRKEEYDNDKLKTLFKPEAMLKDDFPFRVKLEPDAKKMMAFKMAFPDYYKEKLLPIMTEKFTKPTFAIIEKKKGV